MKKHITTSLIVLFLSAVPLGAYADSGQSIEQGYDPFTPHQYAVRFPSYDEVITNYVSLRWRRPHTARDGMMMEAAVTVAHSGDIVEAVVSRSSGDAAFDQSVVSAIRDVPWIAEIQQLALTKPSVFTRGETRILSFRFRPESLSSARCKLRGVTC